MNAKQTRKARRKLVRQIETPGSTLQPGQYVARNFTVRDETGKTVYHANEGIVTFKHRERS